MEQKNSGQIQNTVPPVPKKKKGKTWLWILLAIFIFIPAVSAIFDSNNEDSKDDPKTEEAVEPAKQDSVKSNKDLTKAKQLENLFTYESDEFENLTWVTPKSKPKYLNTTGIYSYFCLKDSIPSNMRVAIQYGADDWLFIKSYTFLIDGKKYEFRNPKMKRDNDTSIWEWSDTGVYDDVDLNEIYARLINAKEAKIRFNGDEYHSDYTIPQSALKSLRDTKDYYLYLGGE